MSQERADLNWYHKPPDYFAGRSGAARERAPAETQQASTPQQARTGQDHDTAAGDFTFDDFLDIINPLQHLPGISMVYRAVTGDEISPHARIIGGGFYGGGTGFVAAIANAISEEASGRDLGDNLMAAVFGEDETAPTVASGGKEDDAAGQSARRADVTGAPLSQGAAAGPGPESNVSANSAGIADAASTVAVPTDLGRKTAAAQSANASGEPAPPAETVDQQTMPHGPATPLEGEAALAALFSDLRGRDRPTSAPEPTVAVVPPSNAQALAPDPRAPLQAASAPGPVTKAGPALPRGGLAFDPSLFAGGGLKSRNPGAKAESAHPFTGQMLHGLHKYEELMARRQVSQADVDQRNR